MEPIPETLEAMDELDAYVDDRSLLEQLTRMAARAQVIAPDCVGVSVASEELGVTFTLVATGEEIAALDAVQYLTTGPCVEALQDGQGLATDLDDLLSEPRWQALGQASAAAGVRSTLTFPIVDREQVVGTVNLYGRTTGTFDGTHEDLAAVFGAWAPGAVANADLSFSTRRVAEGAPDQLRHDALLDVAVGIVAASRSIDVETARRRLSEAAQRAGIPLARLAEVIIDLGHPGSS